MTPSPAHIAKPTMTIKIGTIAAVAFGVFIAVAHFPAMTDASRQLTMVGSIFLLGVLACLGTPRIGLQQVVKFAVPAILILILFHVHSWYFPALTEYASTKRVFFLVIFPTCYVLIPLAIYAYDRNLDHTIRILIGISFLFAVLAFVAPTGENIRRSGIELNPLMHAKLLFFPVFFAIASFGRRRISLPLLLLIGLMVLSTLKTGSRSPLIVVFLIIVIDIFMARSFMSFVRAAVLSAALVLVTYWSIDFLPTELAERFQLIEILDQSSEGDRLFLFRFVADLIAQYPNGIGMGNMSAYFWINAPHNVVLEAVLDFGFAVALPYIALIGFTAWQALKRLKHGGLSDRFLSCWYLFFLGQSLVGGEMTFPSLLLYVPMGLLMLNYLTARRGAVGSTMNGYASHA